MDPATTILFTDDPLVAGTTKVKGIHLTEERTAVNAFRVAAGLLTVTFTDTVGPTLKVKAFHVNELRTALDPARSTLGLTAVPYTDSPTVTANVTKVKAAHFQEIRNGVK